MSAWCGVLGFIGHGKPCPYKPIRVRCTLNAKNPLQRSGFLKMDLRGFEPLTSSMRTRRAPNCATDPDNARNYNPFWRLLARRRKRKWSRTFALTTRFRAETRNENSKQKTRGARHLLLTVAAFRPWRGSQGAVARGPLINAPLRAQPHKRGPGQRNSVLLKRIADAGHRYLPT